MGVHNVRTDWMYFVLGNCLKMVQWTETCRQVYGIDY